MMFHPNFKPSNFWGSVHIHENPESCVQLSGFTSAKPGFSHSQKQMPDVESGKEFTDSNCRRACFPGPELQGSRPVLQPELLRPA